MASRLWNSGTVTTEEDLRAAMTAALGVKKGKTLISDKFTKDHIFVGHSGDVTKMSSLLNSLRGEIPLSTLMQSSMDTTAQAEVKNWIAKVPFTGFAYANGVWTLSNVGTAVDSVNTYNYATIDYASWKLIRDPDDKVKKKHRWLTETKSKGVKIACWFTSTTDCTPVIYHLDF